VGRSTAAGAAIAPVAADSLNAMTAAASPSALPYQQPYGTPPAHAAMSGSPSATGTPGVQFNNVTGVPISGGLTKPADTGEANRTVLGMTAPVIPQGAYAQNASPQSGGAPYRPSGQQAAAVPSLVTPSQPHAAYPSAGGWQGGASPQQPSQNPSYPTSGGWPAGAGAPPQQAPYGSQQSGPYGQPQGYAGVPQSGPYSYGGSGQMALPVDHAAPAAEGKRSTLMRDIGIGVGIAALVLVGFLVVKLVILDGGSSGSTGNTAGSASAKLATVKLSLPPNMTAEMFVDGARVGTVAHDQTVGVKAGEKHIKLVGSNGLTCDEAKVMLEAGKTTTLECGFGVKAGSDAGSAAGSAATGSAATGSAATGSAATGSATTTQAGSAAGSAAVKTDATKTEVKADATKTGSTTTAAGMTTKTDTTKTGTSTKTDTTKTKTEPAKIDTAKTDTTKTDTTKTGTKTTKTGTGTKTDTTKASEEKAADPTKGYLQVFCKPQAKILLDGVETGMKTPINGHALSLTPGKHKVTFVIGDDRFTYPVVIKAGATETMSKDLQ
jgi:hypothetical protein